jgi:putative acetyltransferase
MPASLGKDMNCTISFCLLILMMVKIVRVENKGEGLDTARKLFIEYATELNENLSFQKFDDELKDPLGKYGKPAGRLLIAYWQDVAVGCVALQSVAQPGVCEMKRLYVQPNYRKFGIGQLLVQSILQEAKILGYKKMVLDTLGRLQAALKLYVETGFVNTSAYYANPLPGVVFMEKDLGAND